MDEISDLATHCRGVLNTIDAAAWTGMSMVESHEQRLARLRRMLGNPADLCVRPVGSLVTVMYLSTIVDEAQIQDTLVGPLSQQFDSPPALANRLAPIDTYGDALNALLSGKAIALTRQVPGALAANTGKWPKRDPTEPPAEVISRGPHTGFIERLDTNVALIRMGVPDPRLRYENFVMASRSGTKTGLFYVEGLVSPKVLQRVRDTLKSVRPSMVTDARMLAQHLTPSAHLFPTVGSTERPDVAYGALLEGRVVVLTDGSPTALLIPQVFANLLSVPDDYYNRGIVASFERAFRFLGLLGTLTISALYVSLASVNHELVPTPLFLSIAQARLGIPMPLVLEILALEATIELIRQAGLRLPSSFGQSIAVVGAVVIGQSAVLAGLLSAPAVVVVSVGFIMSFILPSQATAMSLRILRFPLILLADAFGLFGLVWGLLLLFIYLSSLESFGVPYLSPVMPLRLRGLQDTIVRRSLRKLRRSFVARPSPTSE